MENVVIRVVVIEKSNDVVTLFFTIKEMDFDTKLKIVAKPFVTLFKRTTFNI